MVPVPAPGVSKISPKANSSYLGSVWGQWFLLEPLTQPSCCSAKATKDPEKINKAVFPKALHLGTLKLKFIFTQNIDLFVVFNCI